VVAEIRDGAAAIGDGIAINAAVRAGVIGTDVARQGAAAARAVAALPRFDRRKDQLG